MAAKPVTILYDKIILTDVDIKKLATASMVLVVSPGLNNFVNFYQIFSNIDQTAIFQGASKQAFFQIVTDIGDIVATGENLVTINNQTILGFGTFQLAYKDVSKLNNQGINLKLSNPINLSGGKPGNIISMYLFYSIQSV